MQPLRSWRAIRCGISIDILRPHRQENLTKLATLSTGHARPCYRQAAGFVATVLLDRHGGSSMADKKPAPSAGRVAASYTRDASGDRLSGWAATRHAGVNAALSKATKSSPLFKSSPLATTKK